MATAIEPQEAPQFAPTPGDELHPASRQNVLRWWLILLLVWCFSGIYQGRHLKRGWVPWDAGAYAESADRVLHGQLPHRDFVEVYTGGLTYLNAVAMRLFGENLVAERMMMFAFFMAWIPALYWIASQFATDWIAAALVLLAVAWSVPNYSEAVPSWYNLFFATFGIAALLAYTKRATWKWLLLAGLCGGLSCLAKSMGLCYIAGVLLFFLFREQSVMLHQPAREAADESARSSLRAPLYTAFLLASLVIFLVVLLRVISPLASLGPSSAGQEFVLFVLPGAALCVVLVANELAVRHSRESRSRFETLFRMAIPFAAGALLPILIFLAPYVRAHAIGALMHDLFTQATTRIAGAYKFPDELVTILPSLFLIATFALATRLRGLARWILSACVAGLLLSGVILAWFDYNGYIAVWSAAYWLPPLLVVTGSAVVLPRLASGAGGDAQRLFLLLSLMALCGIVEFPYSAPIYFCYVAPLAILVIAALMQYIPRVPRPLLGSLYACFLIFAVFAVTPGFIFAMGFRYAPDTQTTAMNLSRAGGLRVDAQSAAVYGQLIPLIRAHAGSGDIYAAPDCPEVYFLSGYRNLTPDVYDFLGDPAAHEQLILRVLAEKNLRVVVLNDNPALSPRVSESVRDAIARRFPQSATVGNFEVRWRK